MIKKGMPEIGELVICTIDKINPNSVFVKLVEYDKEGMIHISEVASGWIRDIRHHVKQGQMIVAKVINIDLEKNFIALSIKRVSEEEEKEKLKEFKLEQKAEKMLGQFPKDIDVEKIVDYFIENFGGVYNGFLISLTEPEKINLPKNILDIVIEVAKNNIEQKEFVFKSEITMKTTRPDGIEAIKSVLLEAQKNGLDIKYISAPNYLIKFKTKDAKKGSKDFDKLLEKISTDAKKNGIEVNIKKV